MLVLGIQTQLSSGVAKALLAAEPLPGPELLFIGETPPCGSLLKPLAFPS